MGCEHAGRAADEVLARWVGKSGGLFVDESDQLVYHDHDLTEVLVKAAGKLKAPLFEELSGLPARTARAIADGERSPSPTNAAEAMSAIEARLGPDPLPRLLDLADLIDDLRCKWPACTTPPVRPGASWCAAHRRRSGNDRRRALEGAEG
jgi:hypothetical protein